MAYEPLHHKYRPQSLAQLVGQEAIAQTLTNAINSRRIAPAYLFTGPRGTGKTSSARILAKSLNCLTSEVPTAQPCGKCDVCLGITQGRTLDVIEIDAASNTGVDNIRDLIEKAQFAPAQCRYKVYVIDECHMLSVAAFNSLLKTLEEPPEHVVFVLATTDPQRVLPTIISRCQRFDFRRIPLEAMVKHLRYIADQEQINITDESIYLVAQIAQGGLRDAESLLDQLSLLPDQIGAEQVWDLVGTVPERDLVGLLEAIAGDQPTQLLERTRQIMDRGREPLIVLQNLAGFYRDLLIAKTAPDRSNLVALTQPTWEHLCKFVEDYDLSNILAGQKHLQESEVQIKNTTQPRLWLEVTLLGLLPSAIQQKLTVIASPAPNNIPSNPPATQQGRSPDPLPFDPSPPNHQVNQNQANNNQVNNQVNNQTNTPVASPISSPSPVYELSTSADMTEIWERVLSLVQPNATQQLYRQQVSLLTFDGQLAVIAVRSKPIYGLVATKITNLEKAFEVLFNKTIKVKLQISNSSKSQVNSLPPVNSTNQNNPVNNPVNNGNHSINSPAPTVEQPAHPIDPNTPQAVDQQQVAIASQKIAQLFAGEIIAIAPEFYSATGNTGNGINSVNISQNVKSEEKEQVNNEQLDMTNLKIKLTELTETLAEDEFLTDDSSDLDDEIEF